MNGSLGRLLGRSRAPLGGLRPRPVSLYERRPPGTGTAGPQPPDGEGTGYGEGAVDDGVTETAGKLVESEAAAEEAETIRAPRMPRTRPVPPTPAVPPTPPVEEPPANTAVPLRDPSPRPPSVSHLPLVHGNMTNHQPAAAETGPRSTPPTPESPYAPEETHDLPDAAPAARLPVAPNRPLLRVDSIPPPALAAAPPSVAGEGEPAVVVEVSIGRLDVRTPQVPAQPQVPAPRPATVRANHAKALESYLRRRAEGELG
ncbi:hypothetical protein [Streptomyces sp. NPDC000888]